MRIAKIIGHVTLNQMVPEFKAGTLKLAEPQSLRNLTGASSQAADPLVVYDTLGAGEDNLIMITEGAEAAQAFFPEIKPVDAYNCGILDNIDLSDDIR